MGKKIQYIGRYVMDGVTLGKGNFARVELATHEVNQIKVAIKVLDTKKIKEDYIRNNLHREARIMAQLRHPNIIRLYETLKATTLYCLVLEYAAGGELLAHIKEQKDQRLTESGARPFIRQLVSALHYLHERGVVHRDLKMENIMLDESKKSIKLIDFGFSNVYQENDPLKTHCGSPEYAAPELFIVGKFYGPEIDIWSLGIITYAIVVGKLPFFTPFKDEYQRQRMLQQIQKGLSQYNDREMQSLSPDCRNLLHQLIEPNPELRIPLYEVQIHPWLTKNGKYPFAPYQPPPRDKSLRHQIVSRLAIMMELKRHYVQDTVKEHRADELSAMFNMMLDQKKKEMGMFNHDHTIKKGAKRDRDSRSRSHERDRVKTPDGSAGISLKSRHRKVSSRAMKAGPSSKALIAGTPTSTGTPGHHMPHPGFDHPLMPDSCVPNKPKTNTNTLGLPGEKPTSPNSNTNNPSTRIPLSQRRVPPAKLNLTLDLSVTNLKDLPHHIRHKTQPGLGDLNRGDFHSGASRGIEASSGVRPKITSPTKSSPTNSKIPVLSPTKSEKSTKDSPSRFKSNRPNRPSSLQCRTNSRKSRSSFDNVSSSGHDKSKGAIPKRYGSGKMAPRATPEDSLIDSYSTSSDEETSHRRHVHILETTAQIEVPMQPEMLNASDDEKLRHAMMEHQGLLTGNTSDSGSDSQFDSIKLPVRRTDAQSTDKGLHSVKYTDYLVKQLSESEPFDSSVGSLNVDSETQLVKGSGSSLPAHFQPGSQAPDHHSPEFPNSSTCLLSNSGSQPFSASAVKGSSTSTIKEPKLTLSLSNQTNVNLQKTCIMCGLSPASPTYHKTHHKFCHTGAHALDVFVSPDELPSPYGWQYQPSTSQDNTYSQTLNHGAYGYRLPKVGAATPRIPMQMPIASADAFTDDEYEEDEDDDEEEDFEDTSHKKPLIPKTQKCPSPSQHIPSVNLNAKGGKTKSAKEKRLSANSGVYASVPDSNIRLDTVESPQDHHQPDIPPDSGDMIPLSILTTKIHPQDHTKDDSQAVPSDNNGSSKIPRPSSRLSSLLHLHRKHHSIEKCEKLSDEHSSLPSSPQLKNTEKNKLLRQYDHKSKQYSWRQGLSHLLKMARPNSNNNIRGMKNKQSNGTSKCNNVPKGDSVQQGNHGNHGSSNMNSKQPFYKELEAKWTAPPSPVKQCNSMPVTVTPVPSNSSSPVKVYDLTSSPTSISTSPVKSKKTAHKHTWTGCNECARSDQSSDEGQEMIALEQKKVSNALCTKGPLINTVLPAAGNSVTNTTHMISKV